MKILAFVCLLLLALPFASAQEQSWDDLPAGRWSQLEPAGDTVCSNDTPYSFFVYPNPASDNLLIHFQGGGACWFDGNCDPQGSPTYDPSIDDSDNPARYPVGIFDLDNPENPFRDYSMVMLPYCTGDVHIGNVVRTYAGEEGEFSIQHRGTLNSEAVLSWLFDHYTDPDAVFVTGCSAGAIPSPFYTPLVAAAYPQARIAQLGDAAGGYRADDINQRVLQQWGIGAALPEDYPVAADEVMFDTFYIEAAKALPDVQFAQYNTYNDSVQRGFRFLLGHPTALLLDQLQPSLDDIQAATPGNFNYYTAWGDGHCVTVANDFYTYQVNGVRFRDWVAAIAAGEPVADVACTDCETEELYVAED